MLLFAQKFNTRLASVILLLMSVYSELQSHLPASILPNLKPLKMAWNEELGILIPDQWNETYTRDNINSLGHHLLVSWNGSDIHVRYECWNELS